MGKGGMARLAASIVVCEAAGILGSVATAPAITVWYSGLVKPSFTPPNWIFGPAWTILYFLMGISLYLIWDRYGGDSKERAALSIFALQLFLNVLWSALFFGLHSPIYGLIGIVALWIAIFATIASFYRISRPAAAILIPYILWVTFAALLNLYVYLLN